MTGTANPLDGTTQNVIIMINGVIVITMIAIGGSITAMPSFLLAGGIGAGMTVGGIRPGVMTRTIPTTSIMIQSMAMTVCNPTR